MAQRHPVRLVAGGDGTTPDRLLLAGLLELNTTADDLIIAWRTGRLRIDRGEPVAAEDPAPVVEVDDSDPADEAGT